MMKRVQRKKEKKKKRKMVPWTELDQMDLGSANSKSRHFHYIEKK